MAVRCSLSVSAVVVCWMFHVSHGMTVSFVMRRQSTNFLLDVNLSRTDLRWIGFTVHDREKPGIAGNLHLAQLTSDWRSEGPMRSALAVRITSIDVAQGALVTYLRSTPATLHRAAVPHRHRAVRRYRAPSEAHSSSDG